MATLRLCDADRRAVIDETRAELVRIVEARRPMIERLGHTDPGGPGRNCVLWAALVVDALEQRGVRALFQAGSAGWPRLRPDQDDGRPETMPHFSYLWHPANVVMLVVGRVLPEMHAWAVVPHDSGADDLAEFIDPTTGHQPENCRAMLGADWPGDRPPEHLWCLGRELRRLNYYYHPSRGATALGLEIAAALRAGEIGVRPEAVRRAVAWS